ncbi:hypothetical protein Tco_0186175 [Tanacetum coccineum]
MEAGHMYLIERGVCVNLGKGGKRKHCAFLVLQEIGLEEQITGRAASRSYGNDVYDKMMMERQKLLTKIFAAEAEMKKRMKKAAQEEMTSNNNNNNNKKLMKQKQHEDDDDSLIN